MSTSLWFLHNLATVHVNEPTLSIVELSGAPGDTPPLHLHADEDETFYVLDGEVTLHIAGQDPVVLGAGNSVFRTADDRIGLELLNSRAFDSGNVLLCYQPTARQTAGQGS